MIITERCYCSAHRDRIHVCTIRPAIQSGITSRKTMEPCEASDDCLSSWCGTMVKQLILLSSNLKQKSCKCVCISRSTIAGIRYPFCSFRSNPAGRPGYKPSWVMARNYAINHDSTGPLRSMYAIVPDTDPIECCHFRGHKNRISEQTIRNAGAEAKQLPWVT